MSHPRVLIAGIGNIFLGDDGFGVEVARRLAARPQPDGVRVVDFGIRGFDLAYALMEGSELAVLMDALPQGGTPGTLYVLEPDPGQQAEEVSAALSTHGMDPARVLQLVRALGGACPPLRVVGCEPATFGSEEEPMMGLSGPVAAAVEEAVGLVEGLVRDFFQPVAHNQETETVIPCNGRT
jgi:hydrogenase maturation protease